METMTSVVSHHQASQLLFNKSVVILGDSNLRAMYKDIVLLLQKEKYLSMKQLITKGERSFEQDRLVEGGCLDRMHNGTEYREVRQFQSDHHRVRFYFLTRIFSHYMKSILEDFRRGPKPDMVIVNSCLWDITRYSFKWVKDYKKDLHMFFEELRGILPKETLLIWTLAMPVDKTIRGGFLVPEVKHKAEQVSRDVVYANSYSWKLAKAYGIDVVDLHFRFRLSLQHRAKDGIHWNALAHRRMTSLLLQHAAQAWGVMMPVGGDRDSPVGEDRDSPVGEDRDSPVESLTTEGRYDFMEDHLSTSGCMDFTSFGKSIDPRKRQQKQRHELPMRSYGPYCPPPTHTADRRRQRGYGPVRNRSKRQQYHRQHYAPYSNRQPTHHSQRRH